MPSIVFGGLDEGVFLLQLEELFFRDEMVIDVLPFPFPHGSGGVGDGLFDPIKGRELFGDFGFAGGAFADQNYHNP